MLSEKTRKSIYCTNEPPPIAQEERTREFMQTTCFISLNLHSNRYNVNRVTAYLAKQASLFRVFPHYSILEYSSDSSVKPRLKFSMRQQLMLTSVSYSGMSSRLTHMASESSSFCMWIVSSPSSSAVKPAISESL